MTNRRPACWSSGPRFCIAVLALFNLTPPSAAQCDFERLGIYQLRRYENGGIHAINGDRAYRFTYDSNSSNAGLLIFDISDIDNPTLVSKSTFPESIESVDVRNGVARMFGSDDSPRMFYTYDASDPDRLTPIASFDVTGTPLGAWHSWMVRGDYLFQVAQGFFVYDVSDPSSPPQLVASFAANSTGGQLDIGLGGTQAYASLNGTTTVFDISDPPNTTIEAFRPDITGELIASGAFLHELRSIGGHAVVRKWDMALPGSPNLVGTWTSTAADVEARFRSEIFRNGRGYLHFLIGHQGHDDGGGSAFESVPHATVIDLETMETVSEVPVIPISRHAGPIAWTGDQLYDFTNMLDPIIGRRAVIATGARMIAHDGDRIYALDSGAGRLMTFADPALDNKVAEGWFDFVPPEPGASSLYLLDMQAHGEAIYLHSEYRLPYPDGYHEYTQIYDLSDPAEARYVGVWATDQSPPQLRGSIAYQFVDDQVLISSLEDPLSPVEIASFSTQTGDVIALAFVPDSELLLVSTQLALEIVDLSDTTAPVWRSVLHEDGWSVGTIAASPTHAFGITGNSFAVFDISNPDEPFFVTRAPPITPGNRLGTVQVFDDLVVFGPRYVHCSNCGNARTIYDVSDPSAPRLLTDASVGEMRDVFIHDGILYMAGDEPRTFDLQPDTLMASVGSTPTTDTTFGVATAGDHAFVSDYYGGLRIFNIADPTAPAETGAFVAADRAYHCVVRGDLAFVANGESGLLILDVSDASAPAMVGQYVAPGRVLGLAVEGDTAYLATHFAGLQIVDVTTPSAPVFVGGVDTPGNAQSVTVDGPVAYVADGSGGLHTIDVANRSSPTIIGTFDTSGSARETLIRGSTAFVAFSEGGLVALDISEPADPQLIGTVDGMADARGIAAWGHLAFVADFSGRVHMVDIADPAEMQVLQSVDTLGTARALAADGRTLYLADGDAGLTVLEAQPCWYRPCPADLNDDGLLDFFDVQAFLNAYSDEDGLADWNDDGAIDFFDLQRYVADLTDGCG